MRIQPGAPWAGGRWPQPSLGAGVDLGQEGYAGRLKASARALGAGTAGWWARAEAQAAVLLEGTALGATCNFCFQ